MIGCFELVGYLLGFNALVVVEIRAIHRKTCCLCVLVRKSIEFADRFSLEFVKYHVLSECFLVKLDLLAAFAHLAPLAHNGLVGLNRFFMTCAFQIGG